MQTGTEMSEFLRNVFPERVAVTRIVHNSGKIVVLCKAEAEISPECCQDVLCRRDIGYSYEWNLLVHIP